MDYIDLFGEGAIYNNGSLGIPQANLQAVGLSTNSKVSIVVAILFLLESNLYAELADFDNSILIDEDGDSIVFLPFREQIHSRFRKKRYNFEDNSLLWEWEVIFYA